MATCTIRLADAKENLHQLQMGTMAVSVQMANGSSVTYHKTDTNRLSQYIQMLEKECGNNFAKKRYSSGWIF